MVSWENWFGNQRCKARRIEQPDTVADIQEAVIRAVHEGYSIRPVGAGHSLTAVIPTNGVLLKLKPMSNININLEQQTARIPAGHTIQKVADSMFDAGAAMINLGELKEATLIGALSTGVHGTGIGLKCLASSVQALRIVTADGSIREITETDTDLLRAARVSLGMLGVISEVTVKVLPAFGLHERSFFCSADELAERWDEMVHANRHFSFFYLPDATAISKHTSVVPQIMASLDAFGEASALEFPTTEDTCLVTVRDMVDEPNSITNLKPGERCDRMDKILNYEFNSPYREIEFGVPFENSAAVFLEMRRRVKKYYPDYDQPMLVRFAAQDDAMLSWFNTGPKAIFSVVEDVNAPYQRILADFENFFDENGALPHWGKEHTLTKSRLSRLQPEYENFLQIRRELDPMGVFLNEHLSALFE